MYDRNGNLDSAWNPTGALSYSYDVASNRLLEVSGRVNSAYTYDANGNMTSDTAKGMRLHYDLYNQLDSVQLTGYGPPYLLFGYNTSGERVYKKYVHWYRSPCPPQGGDFMSAMGDMGTDGFAGPGDPPPDTTLPLCWYCDTTETYYVFGGGKVLAEYSNPTLVNTPARKYIYAGDRRIAMIDQLGNLFFYLNDHLGSARVVLNAQTGQIADYHWYYAYGAPLGEQTSTGQAYKYTGKPFDDEGGFDLYYYGARYYDPEIGMFRAVDPLFGKYAGWGPYVYTLGNPVRIVDPDGRDPVTVLQLASVAYNFWNNRVSDASATGYIGLQGGGELSNFEAKGVFGVYGTASKAEGRSVGMVAEASLNVGGAIGGGVEWNTGDVNDKNQTLSYSVSVAGGNTKVTNTFTKSDGSKTGTPTVEHTVSLGVATLDPVNEIVSVDLALHLLIIGGKVSIDIDLSSDGLSEQAEEQL